MHDKAFSILSKIWSFLSLDHYVRNVFVLLSHIWDEKLIKMHEQERARIKCKKIKPYIIKIVLNDYSFPRQNKFIIIKNR